MITNSNFGYKTHSYHRQKQSDTHKIDIKPLTVSERDNTDEAEKYPTSDHGLTVLLENNGLFHNLHSQKKGTAKTKQSREQRGQDVEKRTAQKRERAIHLAPENTGILTDMNLSNVSDDEFNCYNNSDGKPMHTNVEDELQILSKETRLTPETGINHDHITTKLKTPIRRSRRLPFAKQTEKLGGIPYRTNIDRKRIKSNHDLLQENRTRPQENNEEEEDRNIRINTSNKPKIYCIIRIPHQITPQLQSHMEGGM